MSLFNFGKKKNEVELVTCCCSQNNRSDVKAETEGKCCCADTKEISCIKVLGAGCKACHELYENVKKAAELLNISVNVEYVTDIQKIMEYGVMSMPVLVVNDKVVYAGKVLKRAEAEKILRSYID